MPVGSDNLTLPSHVPWELLPRRSNYPTILFSKAPTMQNDPILRRVRRLRDATQPKQEKPPCTF